MFACHTRILLGALIFVLPAAGQVQFVELTFEGVGCKPCIESLPERLRRIRGVESASVDPEKGLLTVRLQSQNRVRIEQIRDFVEQDGTKARRATVRIAGEIRSAGGQMILRPPNLPATYIVESDAIAAGPAVVTGTATDLRPESGVIAIRATEVRKPD